MATIDEDGSDHIAAICTDDIVYATRHPRRDWQTEVLRPPDRHGVKDVQLAVDGETITLGYTQYARVVDGYRSYGPCRRIGRADAESAPPAPVAGLVRR